jgi:hypothetical protein
MEDIKKFGDDPAFDLYLKEAQTALFGKEQEITIHPKEQTKELSEIKIKPEPKVKPMIEIIKDNEFKVPYFKTKNLEDRMVFTISLPEIESSSEILYSSTGSTFQIKAGGFMLKKSLPANYDCENVKGKFNLKERRFKVTFMMKVPMSA